MQYLLVNTTYGINDLIEVDCSIMLMEGLLLTFRKSNYEQTPARFVEWINDSTNHKAKLMKPILFDW